MKQIYKINKHILQVFLCEIFKIKKIIFIS